MSTSQNGWRALISTSALLYTWELPLLDGDRPGQAFHIKIRRGSVGFCLAHFAMRWDGAVEDIDGGIMDDWGWAFRPVRGFTTTLSNHSSGTAIDLNATQHPLGIDTMTDEDEAKIRRILKAYDGVLRWGGDYHGRKDQMHVELADGVSMAQVEKVAKKLMGTKRGERLLVANPKQKKVILS